MTAEKTSQQIKEKTDQILKEVKEDILQLEFGRITIFIEKGVPFRKEVRKSKTFRY